MKKYKYEMHAHTSEVSRCGRISAAELVQTYKEYGYTGVFITDHFLNGNTTVPQYLPWEERIELFCHGYRKAFEEGQKIGIDVFFAWEYSYKGTDLLTYGLDWKWLLKHPEIMEISVNQYCELVRREGGFLVHAHPFREAEYIDMIRLMPRIVDAVEVDNACRTDFENRLAEQYADNYGLLKIAGSDNHNGRLPRFSGLEFDEPVKSVEKMLSEIKAGKAGLFSI